MNPQPNIVWLASYPKSGNTWFRVFLSNLFSETGIPIDINTLQQTPIASSRQIFDDAAGISASDLSQEEVENLRPFVYRQLSTDSKELLYQKIHDAWHLTSSGEPLVPADATRAVIYFIRNPLEVAVSFAHHSGSSIEKIIGHMIDPGYAFCRKDDRLHNQLEQKLLTWSGHVNSWTKHSGLPVKVLRYEDMKQDTFRTFSNALAFIGLKFEKEDIERAIRFSDFSELKKQENEKGFREKPPRAESFFRKGETSSWKNVLTPEQINQIIQANRPLMQEYGYLDQNGKVPG